MKEIKARSPDEFSDKKMKSVYDIILEYVAKTDSWSTDDVRNELFTLFLGVS